MRIYDCISHASLPDLVVWDNLVLRGFPELLQIPPPKQLARDGL